MATTDLDSTDHRILDLLVQDARRSASEIGRLVGLSPPAAKRRIDRLEAAGFICGYVRVRDLEHLKDVVDRIRRGRRGGPKVIGTRTIIVLGRTAGTAAG